MARRKTKKEIKQQLKDDSFRNTMFDVGKVLKEYKYVILLTAAVIILFSVLLSMRSERKEKELLYVAELIKPNTKVGPEELLNLAKKVEGESLEPWILVRYGSELYELYQKEDSLSGDKTRLQEAKTIFEDIIKRFGDNGSIVFVSKNALELIDKELNYDYPEPVIKAYERRKNPPKPATPNPPIKKQPPAIIKDNKTNKVDTKNPEKTETIEKEKTENNPEKKAEPQIPEKDN